MQRLAREFWCFLAGYLVLCGMLVLICTAQGTAQVTVDMKAGKLVTPRAIAGTSEEKQGCIFAVGQNRAQVVGACGEPMKYFDAKAQRNLPFRPTSTAGPVWEVYRRKAVQREYDIRLLYKTENGSEAGSWLHEVRFHPYGIMNAEEAARDLKEISGLCNSECSVQRDELTGETFVVGERALFTFITTGDAVRSSDWRSWPIKQLVFAEKFACQGCQEIAKWGPTDDLRATSKTGDHDSISAQMHNGNDRTEPGQQSVGGPFGFRPGMTREQITKLVGTAAIKVSETSPDVLILSAAPKSHRAFKAYLLVVSPSQGLLKILAMGQDVNTGDTGAELQSAFESVLAGVTQKYGPPAKKFDFCRSDTVGCSGPSVWMLGLLQKNRTLESFWSFDPTGSITSIDVDASATSLSTGRVDVTYEFQGFVEYQKAKESRQNDSY